MEKRKNASGAITMTRRMKKFVELNHTHNMMKDHHLSAEVVSYINHYYYKNAQSLINSMFSSGNVDIVVDKLLS